MFFLYIQIWFINFEPFSNDSQVIIDPILETNGIRTTWKQVGIISGQHRFSIFVHDTKIIYIDQNE